MGDRYILTVNCPYCQYKDDEYWYAPTCGSDDFHCPECGKISFMDEWKLIKAEETKPKILLDEFLSALNMWKPNEEDKRSIFKEIQKKVTKAKKHNKEETKCSD